MLSVIVFILIAPSATEKMVAKQLSQRFGEPVEIRLNDLSLNGATFRMLRIGQGTAALTIESGRISFMPEELKKGVVQSISVSGLRLTCRRIDDKWTVGGLDKLLSQQGDEPLKLPFKKSLQLKRSVMIVELEGVSRTIPFDLRLVPQPDGAVDWAFRASPDLGRLEVDGTISSDLRSGRATFSTPGLDATELHRILVLAAIELTPLSHLSGRVACRGTAVVEDLRIADATLTVNSQDCIIQANNASGGNIDCGIRDLRVQASLRPTPNGFEFLASPSATTLRINATMPNSIKLGSLRMVGPTTQAKVRLDVNGRISGWSMSPLTFQSVSARVEGAPQGDLPHMTDLSIESGTIRTTPSPALTATLVTKSAAIGIRNQNTAPTTTLSLIDVNTGWSQESGRKTQRIFVNAERVHLSAPASPLTKGGDVSGQFSSVKTTVAVEDGGNAVSGEFRIGQAQGSLSNAEVKATGTIKSLVCQFSAATLKSKLDAVEINTDSGESKLNVAYGELVNVGIRLDKHQSSMRMDGAEFTPNSGIVRLSGLSAAAKELNLNPMNLSASLQDDRLNVTCDALSSPEHPDLEFKQIRIPIDRPFDNPEIAGGASKLVLNPSAKPEFGGTPIRVALDFSAKNPLDLKTLSYSLVATLPSQSVENLSIGPFRATGNVDATLAVTGTGSSCIPSFSAGAALYGFSGNGIESKKLTLGVKADFRRISYRQLAEINPVALDPSSLPKCFGTVSAAGNLRHGEKLTVTDFSLTLPLDFLDTPQVPPSSKLGSIRAKKISYDGQSATAFEASCNLTRNSFSTEGKFNHNQFKLSFSQQANWAERLKGKLRLSLSEQRLTSLSPWASLAPALETINADGSIGATATVIYDAGKLSSSAVMSLRNFSIEESELKVSLGNLNTRIHLPDLAGLRSKRIDLEFDTLTIGTEPLGPGSASLRLDATDDFTLESFRLNCYDGLILAGPSHFNPKDPTLELTLICEKLNLQSLLDKLPKFKGEASGSLYGRVPLTYKEDKLTITDGFLHSIPGEEGVVRITEFPILYDALAGNERGEKIQQALQNFKYTSIAIEINAPLNEKAVVFTRLRGFDENKTEWDFRNPTNFRLEDPLKILKFIDKFQ